MLLRWYPRCKIYLPIILVLFMFGFSTLLTVLSEDLATEIPPSDIAPTAIPTATATETWTIAPSATLVEIVLPTDSEVPSLEAIASATSTNTASITDTPLAQESPEFTETLLAPTEALVQEATIVDTVTQTFTPGETTAIPLSTITDIPSATVTLTLGLTIEPELTETVEVTATVLPVEPAVATAIPMMTMQGLARYQNHVPDNSGIQIGIANGSGLLLSTTNTASDGSYAIVVPSEEFFWLVVNAPLHRQFKQGVWPGEKLPEVILAGGDLDGDGCVGPADLALLLADFSLDASAIHDISGDHQTDASDLAILAGNYDPASCLVLSEVTATATPTVTVTETNLITPTDMATNEATEQASITPESTVETEGETK